MSKDVIEENYKPLLTQHGYTTRVRTKINTAGHRVCQCWDEERNPRDLPEDWLNNEYDVQVAIVQLWLMGNSFRLTMEATNLLVHPLQTECPFSQAREKDGNICFCWKGCPGAESPQVGACSPRLCRPASRTQVSMARRHFWPKMDLHFLSHQAWTA